MPELLRILALVQGWYGHRILQNVNKHIPTGWVIDVYEFPQNLPSLIEKPKEYIPNFQVKKEYNLILSLGEHPSIASLLPKFAEVTSVKAVIAPIGNSAWTPPGVRSQILDEFHNLNVKAVFPKPFCTFESNTGDKLIDDFAERFGKPKLKIHLDGEVIKNVKVLRGSPCGSTFFAIEKLRGLQIEEAAMKASLLVQTYPCLASRKADSELGTPLIHVAANILKNTVLKKNKLEI